MESKIYVFYYFSNIYASFIFSRQIVFGFSLGHFLGKWPKDFENDLNFEDF